MAQDVVGGTAQPDGSAEVIRSVLRSAPDAIVGVDQSGHIVLLNAQAERLFGYRAEELLGRPVEVLVPGGHQARHEGHRSEYLADPRSRPMGAGMELSGVRRDGSEFPAEISLSPIRTDTGLIVATWIRDVTERHRESAARNRLASIAEAAPDAIVCVSRDGTIVMANAQVERLFGYSRAELIGRPVELLVPERARAVHPGHRSQYHRNPRPRPMGSHMNLSAVRKDGTEFPAEISLSALQTTDGVLVSAAIRDVTERVAEQTERERLRVHAEREQLQRRLAESRRIDSLGQLAGGVAHDFNNLLAVMLNYTSFIAEHVDEVAREHDDPRWGQIGGDLAQIRRAGERAAELTHQLLAFGRREVIRPRVLRLTEVLSQVEPMLRRTLGEHVQVHTQAEPDLWPVLADPGQIEQVVVNLAVNARDAMPGGGTLTMSLANAMVADRPDAAAGRYVKLRVSDTGVGIPSEVVDRIFEPFFTTKPRGEGTGLGLATVYGIVIQAGGWIDVDSVPGAGTTFCAVLPATDATDGRPEAESAPTKPQRRPGGATVLLVEDEDALREVVRRILTRNGYAVLSAAHGPEALKIAEHTEQRIDLLLTDVVMPHMLGKELAGRIGELVPGLRVLYMSGYAQPVLASQGTLDPGVNLVEKPFSESDLLEHIRTVLAD